MGMLIAVGVVAAFMLRGVIASSHHGSQRQDLQIAVREAVRRAVPLLRAAVAPNEVLPAIYQPGMGASASEVVFYSTEELMNPAATFDPRNPVYLLYRMRHDPVEEVLWLEDTAGALEPRVVGRNITAATFERTGERSLRLHVSSEIEVRGATGQRRLEDYTLQSGIHLP